MPKIPNNQNQCRKCVPSDWKLYCTDKINKDDFPIDNIQIFKEGYHTIESLNNEELSFINTVCNSHCCNDIDNMLVFRLNVETYKEADDIVSKLNELANNDDNEWYVGDPREDYYI